MPRRILILLGCVCFVGRVMCTIDDDQSILYPFGPNHGDQALHSNDDKSSGSIPIGMNFTFFGKTYSELYVNNNGGVSFGGDITSYTPEAFPLTENYTFIAAYWSDVDTRHDDHGTVYYRETTDPDLLDRLTGDAIRIYGDRGLGFFKTEWAFIATWWEVTYFSGQQYLDYYYNNKGETNTYQMAIITDGTYSFTLFNYGNLMWTTGMAADGQVPAQVGFNAGDGANYFVVPDSRTPDISNIQYTSNVGTTGRWIFRIDQATISADTCVGTKSDLTPTMEDCPRLSDPVLEGGLYVYFYCDISHTYSKKDPVTFEVEFLFDNVNDERVPLFVLKGEETRVRLHEKYLQGNLGKQVSCRAVGFYDNTPHIRSSPSQSNSYFAGIKASTYSVTVYEGDETPTPVYLKSTLPIACSTTRQDGMLTGCKVLFNVHSSDNLVVYQPGKGLEEPSTCQYRLDQSDWKASEGRAYSEAHPLYILPTLSLTTDPPMVEQITFGNVPYLEKRDEAGELYSYMWNDYRPPDVTVYRYESKEFQNGATCYANGDPRISTFDKVFYSVYAEGQFVMAKSLSSRKFEVHVRHEHCRGTFAVSCVCGLAVREGNDTILLDMCHGNLLHKGHMTASTNSKLSSGMKLTANRQGSAFTIQTPSGAFANVHINPWGMNVDLHVPGRDFNQTEGLCGTNDGDWVNEFRPQGSGGFIDPENPHQLNQFVQSWRVPPGESLFEKPPTPVYPDTSTVTQYCLCTDYALDELVPCGQSIADPTTYPEVTYFTVTMPTSEVTGSFFTGRRKRDTTSDDDHLDNVNYDYDPSDFDFAVDSVNSLEFEWPTVSGITEEMATEYCRSEITESAMYKACQDYVENISDIVTKCVADIQVSASLHIWAADKLVEIENQCKLNALSSPSQTVNSSTSSTSTNDRGGRTQTVDWLHELLSDVCPGQCSGRGVCSNAACLCHTGYEGEDCSISSTPPDVVSLSNSGQCDLSLQPCTHVLVSANNLIYTETLSCRVERNLTGTVEITAARFEGYGQVRCGLPLHRDTVHTFSLSVSRDGVHYGSAGSLIVYNGHCIDCSDSGCVIQENRCSIKGSCYHSGDVHPGSPCLVCDPDVSATVWSKGQDKTCSGPSNSRPGTNYALIVCLGIFIPLILLALVVPTLWCIRIKKRKGGCDGQREEGENSSYLYNEETFPNIGRKYQQRPSTSQVKTKKVCQAAAAAEGSLVSTVTEGVQASQGMITPSRVVSTGLMGTSAITPVEIAGADPQGGVTKDKAFDCKDMLKR